LLSLQGKESKVAADAASLPSLASRALNVRWSIPLPGLGAKKPAGSATDGETERDPETDTEVEAEIASLQAEEDAIVRGGSPLPPPEADEELHDIMDLTDDKAAAEGKRKFNIGWGMFVPKLPKNSRKGPTKVDAPLKDISAGDSDSIEEDKGDVPEGEAPRSSDESKPFASDPPQRRDLESKILTELIRMVSSGGFFYSFDFDLTHTLQHKRQVLQARSASGTLLASLLTKNASQEGTFPTSPLPEADVGASRTLGEAFEEEPPTKQKETFMFLCGEEWIAGSSGMSFSPKTLSISACMLISCRSCKGGFSRLRLLSQSLRTRWTLWQAP
jgi:hypothetical protein